MTTPTAEPPVADRRQLGEPAQGRPPAPPPRRLAGLDGLRGLAVLAVVAYHFDALSGGFLGVDLFFVVSGFLITRMMILRRARRRAVTLGWFWRRRVRRLFPAVLVLVVAVVVLVARLDSSTLLGRTRGQGISGLLYVNNWYDLVAHIGYFDVALDKTPLNHLWSLSIEEQFYVVWPVMFIVFARTRRGFSALIAITTVLMVVSMGLAPFWDGRDGWARAYLGTDSRVGAILLGALVSLVLTRHELLGTRWRAPTLWCLRLGSAGAAAFLAFEWWSADVTSAGLYRGGLAGCSLAAAVLVVGVALDGDGVIGSVTGLRPIAWVGKLSYSLYLWHVPIIVLVTRNRTQLAGARLFAVQLLLIITTTLASYYLVERPIHLEGFDFNRVLLAGLAGTACLLAVVVLPDVLRDPQSTGPDLVASARDRGFSPDQVRALTVMVVGDSWGIRTGSAMAGMPDPHPRAVLQLAQPSCGIADPVEEYSSNGTTFTPTERCLAWRTSWSQAMGQKPSFVVMQVGNWDQARQRLAPGGGYLTACDPAFRARYDTRFDEAIAILTKDGTPVFVPSVVDNDGVLRDRSDCMNSMLRAGVARHAAEGVRLLDLEGLLCPRHTCVAKIGGTRAFDETGHIATETLPTVNRWIFAEVGAVLGTQVPATELWATTGGDQDKGSTVPTTAPGGGQASLLTTDVLAAADALGGPDAAGQPAPRPILAVQVLSSVKAVTSRADYPPVVQLMGASQANAAYQLTPRAGGSSAVATFFYEADSKADQTAVALQALVGGAGTQVTVDNANLRHFSLGDTTISFARSWQRLSVTVITGGEPESRVELARTALGRAS